MNLIEDKKQINNKELHEKYPDDFNDEAVEAIKKATQQNLDELMKILEDNKKTTMKEFGKTADEKPTKKRGRKPKKKPDEIVKEVLEANAKMEEEDAEDYEDSPQNVEMIEC